MVKEKKKLWIYLIALAVVVLLICGLILWRVLSACCRASADASIPLSCEQLAERVSSLDPRCSANEALVEAGVGIFVISTYDTDYVLVKGNMLEKAADALHAGGIDVTFVSQLG